MISPPHGRITGRNGRLILDMVTRLCDVIVRLRRQSVSELLLEKGSSVCLSLISFESNLKDYEVKLAITLSCGTCISRDMGWKLSFK